MDPLKIVALVSGGKDSYFAACHCIANGHEVVALANLHPVASEISHQDDLDSFMYQTVGHQILPLQAQCLNLPLYRRAVTGTAVNTAQDYFQQSGDETEDLLLLLQDVKAKHPQVRAVSSGAILSTYQRTRIESVCARLGLVSLAYLWQYPLLADHTESTLLDDLSLAGIHVRIVKVASGGLDESLLGCDLLDPTIRRKLSKVIGRFGGSMLGEGGEYETLVLHGPRWTRSLVLKGQVIASGAGSAFWRFDSSVTFEAATGASVIRPVDIWDARFYNLCSLSRQELPEISSLGNSSESAGVPVVQSCGNLTFVSNLHARGEDTNAQAEELCRVLPSRLAAIGLTVDDIVFATVLLVSLHEDFRVVNEHYGRLFTRPNPPARVAIGTRLPVGLNIALSLVLTPTKGRGLHVQSTSYWAPANIGPYSQANAAPWTPHADLIFVSGQIPLVPSSMRLSPSTRFPEQACLALQHMWRVGEAMGVFWWAGVIAYLSIDDRVQHKVLEIGQIWHRIHEKSHPEAPPEEEDFDVWHQTCGTGQRPETKPRWTLPDHSKLQRSALPGLLIVEIEQLPLGATVEWQGLGVSGTDSSISSVQKWGQGYSMTTCEIRTSAITLMNVERLNLQSLKNTVIGTSHATIFTRDPAAFAGLPAQIIPCRSVWDRQGRQLAAGILLHSYSREYTI